MKFSRQHRCRRPATPLRVFFSACVLFFPGPLVFAQKSAVPVFTAGEEGYRSFRIPAVLRLPGGALLAFAEGRVNGPGDFGEVRIVMKKSTDRGKIWGPLRVVASNGSLQAGNPAPVADLTDPAFPHGRIFLFYDTGDQPEAAIRRGHGTRKVWYIVSRDQGRHWSVPVEITALVTRSGWRAYALTPGHAMQFGWGRWKGRIFVAANHSQGPPRAGNADYSAHGFFTDDHGKTFRLGESVPVPGGNEATAAELPGNGLMMNIRNQAGTPRQRIVATSSDGGSHWDTAFYDARLPDPVCEGSLLTLGRGRSTGLLAFCNNADTVSRTRLTLRLSFDGGRHWPRRYPVADSPGSTGYSDIVRLGRRRVGVLYECDDYRRIVFTRIRWTR